MTQGAIAVTPLRYRFGWLTDGKHDLLFFFLPLIIGLFVVGSANSPVAWAALSLLVANDVFPFLGWFHGGVSWFHYFDEKNRAHFMSTRQRFAVFFFIPLAIVLGTIAGTIGGFEDVLFKIYMFWTVQHLAQQNVGILLLYQNRVDGEVRLSRNMHAYTQQIPALLFGTCFLVHGMAPAISNTCYGVAITVATVLSLNYLRAIFSQARRGSVVNPASVAFAMLSVWFFLPLLVIKTGYWPAMMLPLFIHWCQYIGLNYILVGRKYSEKNQAPSVVQRPIVAFFVFSTAFAATLALCTYFSQASADSAASHLFSGTVMGFALAHYFQDAFLWRFREAFNRESILQYLKAR